MDWRVSDLVDDLARDDRVALLFIDNHGHRRDYRFSEIAEYGLRYAAVLRAFGVHEGERVYVCLSTGGKAIFTLLALERLGAVPVVDEANAHGASTIVANREFRARIDAARSRFARDARYLLIGEECEGWARLDTLAQVASPIDAEPAHSDDSALQHARKKAFDDLGAEPTDVVWYATQFEDPQWYSDAIVKPWLLGSMAVAHSGAFDARERLDLVHELDVTILAQRREDYHAQLALRDAGRFTLPRLRRCIMIGDCDELLKAQWAERFGIPLSRNAGHAAHNNA